MIASGVRHESTKTSREARAIEEKLARDLTAIARAINKDVARFADYSQIRGKYEQLVDQTIHSAVQQLYLLGAKYATDFKKTEALITPADLSQMQGIASDRIGQFWGAVERGVVRETMQSDRPALNTGAAMASLATLASTMALSTATIEKARQIDENAEVIWITALDDRVCPICRPIHGMVWKVGDPMILYPPDDSHPNCRCRLLFKERGQIYSH